MPHSSAAESAVDHAGERATGGVGDRAGSASTRCNSPSRSLFTLTIKDGAVANDEEDNVDPLGAAVLSALMFGLSAYVIYYAVRKAVLSALREFYGAPHSTHPRPAAGESDPPNK